MTPSLALRASTLAAISLFAGCGTGGETASVSGSVTYDGQAVASGEITFSPADGKGPIASGTIDAGKYRVSNLVPGPKVVLVSSVAATPVVMSTEELQKAAEKGVRSPAPAAQLVPPDAEGNGQTIEIKPGSQQLDFTLKAPPRR